MTRLLWVSLFVCAAMLRAQESIDKASIGGRVTDATGASIAGAHVSARNFDTNASSATLTGRDGRFRFPYLRVGRYEIVVQKQGFADAKRILDAGAGAAFDLPISLSLEAARAIVTVNADAAALQTARSQIAGSVSHAEMQQLPLNGRSFLDAALLIPGVSPTNTGSNQLFAETSAAPGQGISIGSQRNFSNSFIVDGLSDNDDAAGLTGAFYGLDAVEEVQVVTSGAQAEFGRALGGYVSLVTRSGTNVTHGDLYGYFRNGALNAANALSHATLPMTQAQYGASLGGPIVHNRTFFFGNFERLDLNQSGLTTISTSAADAINARLRMAGYPGLPVTTGLYPDPVHSINGFAKLDHEVSTDDQLTARYSIYHVKSVDSRGAGGLSAPSASAGLEDTDQIAAVSNVYTLSPRAVNETRGEFWYSSLAAPPTDAVGPAVTIAGVASFGTLSSSPTARRNRMGQVVNNFTYQTGAHAIRWGADFLDNSDTIVFPRSYRGSYSFSSLSNFLSGVYNNSGFTQTFANPMVHQNNPNAGFYMQDEWKASGSLVLNFGLRYDLQFLKTIAIDTNNLAPRAGFAWTPFASRRTVIRGGYGLYYDRIPLRPLANALLSANNTVDTAELSQISVSLSPGQAGAPAFPNLLDGLTLPQDVLRNFSTMDRRMQNAYSEQGSFEIEQGAGSHATISAGYEHIRGRRLIISVNQNVPTCAPSGTNDGCRPDLNYGNDSQYSPLADSQYDALTLSFVERPVGWGNFRASYTYSKALDDVSEFFFSAPMNNFDIRQDWGRSDDDQRHRVVLDASVHSSTAAAGGAWQKLTHGFSLNALFQYYSPLPFNLTTGANTIQGTPARPTIGGVFIGRNTGSGFDFLSLGARVARSFQVTDRVRLEALAEGFNLTNHVNGVSLDGVFGMGSYPTEPAPSFGRVTAVGDPSGFQLAIKLAF